MNRVTSIIKKIVGKLPDFESVRNVYAVVVFLLYSWTLSTSFYQLPSWLFYLDIKQIASIYSYAFSINILESILLLAVIVLLDITVFRGLNGKDFQLRFTILVLVLLGSSMLRLTFLGDYTERDVFVSGQLVWWVCTMVFGILVFFIASKFSWLRDFFMGFAERVVIFLYIYLPLSFISIVMVVFRNLD